MSAEEHDWCAYCDMCRDGEKCPASWQAALAAAYAAGAVAGRVAMREEAACVAEGYVEPLRSGVVDTGILWRSGTAQDIAGRVRALPDVPDERGKQPRDG